MREKLKKLRFASKKMCLYLLNKINEEYNAWKNKLTQTKQTRNLKRMPFYLVMGPSQSGKQSLIANAGLHFIDPETLGREAKRLHEKFSDYDWWFTDEAVFINLSSEDKEKKEHAEKRLIKYLKKNRNKKPISGILLTNSLPNLLTTPHESRQNMIKSMIQSIRNFHASLKAQLPIYLCLTHADQIDGFCEFFNDLSQEELKQTWGISLPLTECSEINPVLHHFYSQFNDIVIRLKQRVLWVLNSEKDLSNRELSFNFPAQMQLFKKPLATFISELFGTIRYPNAIFLRGIYFCSNYQDYSTNDYLLMLTSQTIQIQPNKKERAEKTPEHYFIHRLFRDLILPEGRQLGYSRRNIKIKTLLRQLTWIAAPLSVILFYWTLSEANFRNAQALQLAKQAVNSYQIQAQQLKSDDPELRHTLPILNHVNLIYKTYEQSSFGQQLFFSTHRLRSTADGALTRSIQSLFLPRVAAKLEKKLETGHYNANTLYAILKGYLAFSPSHYSNANAIVAPMEYDWNLKKMLHYRQKSRLLYYLQQSAAQPLPQLPLNRPLINQIRSELHKILPADRAYGLLSFKSAASNLPSINFDSSLGENLKIVFISKSSTPQISPLYTQMGYRKIFKPHYKNIAHQVANDNREIGLSANHDVSATSEEISQSIQLRYHKAYSQQWEIAFASLEIAHPNTLAQAINQLTLLTSQQSPLFKLLIITKNNTSGHKTFNLLNQFTESNSKKSKYDNLLKTLKNIRARLIQIQQAPNPRQSEFVTAKDYMQGNINNPFHQLAIQSAEAPKPIQRWEMELLQNDWDLISQGALKFINQTWKETTYSFYQRELMNRYPLSPSSQLDCGIQNFINFFKQGGLLQTFNQHFIKPFVDRSHKDWRPIFLNGLALKLSDKTLQALHQAATIRTIYFNSPEKGLNFKGIIKPHTLDANASEIRLIAGASIIHYQHGPQNSTPFSWPYPNTAEKTKVVLRNFSGQSFKLTFTGPWSWFRLLQQVNFRSIPNTDIKRMVFKLGHYNASFDLSSTQSISALKLKTIHQFHLPKILSKDPSQ